MPTVKVKYNYPRYREIYYWNKIYKLNTVKNYKFQNIVNPFIVYFD